VSAGQQFYFTSSQQPRFVSGFQQPPSPPQYEGFFQPQTADPYSPFHHVAPQSFSTFQQGSQLYHRPQDFNGYRQRNPSFLDQITLSPGGFSRDQRLLQAYPSDLNHPHFDPQKLPPSTPPAPQDFPSEPDDLGLSTFVDQNLEVDQRPTEDPKSVPRPRQKDRTGDAVLRRKPSTRPQAGSRGNFLSPQRIRGQLTSEKRAEGIESLLREDEEAMSGNRGRSPLQYPIAVPPRTRGRFSATTKAPSKVRQFHVRPSKVPFTPRRPLYPATMSQAAESDDLEESVPPPEGSSDPESREPVVSEDNQEQAAENSTLAAHSYEVTTLLHDERKNTTSPVTGYTGTTDIDDVTATWREEATTVLKEDETPEQRFRDAEGNGSTFEVLTMNPGHTLVEEDNFQGFVDSVLIDATDIPQVSTVSEDTMTEVTPDISTEYTHKPVDSSLSSKPPNASIVTDKGSKLLGVSMVTTVGSRPLGVSVVTTKSVINGTMFALPSPYSVAPPVQEQVVTPVPAREHPTESWVVVASVQTSRRVSGARFLPSSAVKQEETPKTLSGKTPPNETVQSSKPAHSTESIIDKLYRVESELSSGILTGGFRTEGKKLQLEVLTDMTDSNTTTTSTPASTTTYKSPVYIRKFSPHSSRTTPKPNKLSSIFDSIPMDDLSRLLPPGFKQRTATSRRTTTPPAKHADSVDYPQGDEPVKPNNTSARSSGLGSTKNNMKVEESSSAEKPPKKLEDLLSKIKFDDVSAFLPPGFKPQAEEPASTTAKPSGIEGLLRKARPVDVSAFLPPGFKPQAEEPASTTAKPSGIEGLLRKARPVDVSAFLPPGFKLVTTTNKSVLETVNVSTLMPSGFGKENSSTTEATSPADMFRVKFPTRPGVSRKPLMPTHKPLQGPGVPKPKISTGWPTR